MSPSIARSSRCSAPHAVVAVAVVMATAVLGCASGGDGIPLDAARRLDAPGLDAPGLDTGTAVDTGLPPPRDGGPPDGGHDAAPDPCGGVRCAPFQYCASGTCTDYPNCRGDGTCPTPGDVCRSRRCVPGTVDVDGDGDPAATDCDETSPLRSSRLPELCDTIDNDCNGAADDGDPAALCATSPTGGLCMAGGVCACPAGTYDIDRTVPGCECMARPAITAGTSCGTAIDLGELPDTMASRTETGNAIGRDVWYRFRAVDTPDTTCDQFNVGIHLGAASAAEHEIWVLRGGCETGTACPTGTYTDYNFALDFRDDRLGMLTGQCPCWTGTPVVGRSPCRDNSTDVYVRVRRREGAPASCAPFEITFSNGVD